MVDGDLLGLILKYLIKTEPIVRHTKFIDEQRSNYYWMTIVECVTSYQKSINNHIKNHWFDLWVHFPRIKYNKRASERARELLGSAVYLVVFQVHFTNLNCCVARFPSQRDVATKIDMRTSKKIILHNKSIWRSWKTSSWQISGLCWRMLSAWKCFLLKFE